ncbi:MAG: LacI family DNA-binding transcriptional regulator [Acetobacteraceae bacterium]
MANTAGCSIATVSRALTQPDLVSNGVRQRITDAVRTLGYVPNSSARALRSLRTKVVGAIIPTLDHAIYARLVDSLQRRLAVAGVSLIHNTNDYNLDFEIDRVRLLLEHGVEGVLLVGATHRTVTLDLLAEREVPFTVTYALPKDERLPCVGFDNAKAGTLAARHLLGLGHRRLAMIAGITADNDRAADRVVGFLQGLAAQGISNEQVAVVEAPYRMDSGEAAMAHLLRTRPGFTAIFCGSDILATGAIKACGDAGLHVPGQMSVLGFDNLEITRFLTPPLTTIEVPARAMGEQAAEYLLASATKRQFLRRIELETRLVLRETTAPPAT